MANEFSESFRLTYGNQSSFNIAPSNTNFNQTGTLFSWDVQTIPTSATDITIGNVPSSSQGKIYLRNQDTTNYVTVGKDNSGSQITVMRLYPGEWAYLRLEPSITLMATAHTASCNLEVAIFQN